MGGGRGGAGGGLGGGWAVWAARVEEDPWGGGEGGGREGGGGDSGGGAVRATAATATAEERAAAAKAVAAMAQAAWALVEAVVALWAAAMAVLEPLAGWAVGRVGRWVLRVARDDEEAFASVGSRLRPFLLKCGRTSRSRKLHSVRAPRGRTSLLSIRASHVANSGVRREHLFHTLPSCLALMERSHSSQPPRSHSLAA